MTSSRAAAVRTCSGRPGRRHAARRTRLNRLTGGHGRDRFVFDEESGDAVITDFAGDRIDLTAFGFTRSEFEQHVTIEEERFLIDTGTGGDPRGGRRRKFDLADFMG